MEKRKVAVCFSEKQNTSFIEDKRSALFPDVFPDACLGFRFGILPPAGQRSRTKHILWPRLGNLASGGSKISNKNTSREKTHTYIAYIAHIRPYRPHIGPYIYIIYYLGADMWRWGRFQGVRCIM